MLHSYYLLLFSLYCLTNICFCSPVAICRPTGCLYYNKTNIHYTFSSSVRDLCVIPDQELSFAPHLNRLTHDCFYQLHQLGSVARSLSTGALATTVHCFVTNRLNYCLSLYSGLPDVRLACLDRILCSASRLIGQLPKVSHVTSYILKVLSWLPAP